MEKLSSGHADQPRRRRRFRSRRVREDALPDPRPEPGVQERRQRHLVHPDHRRLPPGNARTSLQRLRELSVQSSNGIYTAEDRMQIQVEVSQLVDEIDRIASHAQFNGMNMLTGRFAREDGENIVTGSMWFHIGANMDQRERVYIGTMTAKGLGVKQVVERRDHHARHIPTAPTAPSASSTMPSRRSTSSAPTSAPTRTGSSTPIKRHRHRRREPPGRRKPHPRHRHGQRDGRVHQEPDPHPGVERDARPGEPENGVSLAVAPVREYTFRMTSDGASGAPPLRSARPMAGRPYGSLKNTLMRMPAERRPPRKGTRIPRRTGHERTGTGANL